jgi:molecular chaperone DnaK
MDANGILNVSAKDLGTGKEQSIEIKSSSGLGEEEVERMVKDAETHATEDEGKRKLIDLRNQADQMVYTTEKTLKEHGDKVDAQTRGDIEQAVNRLKDAQKSDDASTIEKAIEAVNTASHRLAEEVYKASGAAPGADVSADAGAGVGAGATARDSKPGEGKDDDVIDAEFEVKE